MTGNRSRFLFAHSVLGRHEARYFLDESCGYIFAERPTWLDEAYSSAISVTDTGCLERNLKNIEVVSQVLERNEKRFQEGVDLGAGYGLFVRGMRDRGFRFYWSDKYADNLLARGFDAEPRPYDAAVAFEVLEHTQNPLAFLQEARARYDFKICFLSATCFDEARLPDTDWWYWAFETGQHISFFSRRALEWIATQLGMQLTFISGDVFALSTDDWVLTLPFTPRVYRRLGRLLGIGAGLRRQPLTFDDHLALRAVLRRSQSGRF
jgi:hypothetical protein